MTASRAFGEQLDSLGIWWPRGDGDALREAARDWTALADLLGDVLAVLDTAAGAVADHQLGDAGRAFTTLWRSWSGDGGYLATTAADCRRLAAALTDFGTDVDVADRTLALLIAEVADGLTPERIDWLRANADGVGAALHGQASARSAPLHAITEMDRPTQPIDVRPLDPDRISWIDPGTPRDLSFLGTTAVDFGAGQGVVPGDDRPPVAGPGEHPPLDGVGLGSPTGATIQIDAPGATIHIGADGLDTALRTPAGTTEPAERLNPGGIPVSVLPTDDALPPDPLVGGGGAGGGGAGGGFGGGGFDPGTLAFEPAAFTPELPDVPDLATNETLASVPVSISPPGAAVVAGAAVGAVAAGAASGGGGRPPLPFMPMGAGGGGGDDGEEPRRRRSRR